MINRKAGNEEVLVKLQPTNRRKWSIAQCYETSENNDWTYWTV